MIAAFLVVLVVAVVNHIPAGKPDPPAIEPARDVYESPDW